MVLEQNNQNIKRDGSEIFNRLFNGDISGYESRSEADMALCKLIASRMGTDPKTIDSVFRASALYSEEWEQEPYREAIITKAIVSTAVSRVPENSTPEFIRFRKNGEPYIVVPLLAKYVREHLDYQLVRNSGKQGTLKYVYKDGFYQLYSDDMFMGIIKGFIAEYDEELIKMSVVSETLKLISTDLNYISQDMLNYDESVINFQNGLLRVTADSIELMPHSPEVYSTIQIPCEWKGSEMPTPVFDNYMKTLTNGDKELEQLLLQFIGVVISNIKGWRLKKALFLVGDGDTGKSQLKSLVEKLLGRGNYIGIDLKEIEARFGTGAIYGTRLAGSSDMSFLSVDELKTFKKITGGDSLFAEFKGQQAFEYTYNGLLWFCMNRLPKFGGDNGQWVYDRIMVVHCPNVIPKDKQDKQLLDKMFEEAPGIIYKAIKALQTVIANGYCFSEPDTVSNARALYMKDNNTVIRFFEECMCQCLDSKPDTQFTTGQIYKAYTAWCKDNNSGFYNSQNEFRTIISKHLGLSYADITTRRNGNTYFKEFTLSTEARDMYGLGSRRDKSRGNMPV